MVSQGGGGGATSGQPVMLSILVATTLFATATATTTVCAAEPNASSTSWPFSAPPGSAPSCYSSNGGTNDGNNGNAPSPCKGDPASVRIAVTRGEAECLVASAAECKIPMREFVSLDYDFNVDGCNGVWAAPLWLTPDTWQWGPGSGEIDSLEFCARDAIHMNFAGGGSQKELDSSDFSIDSSHGHVTVRKDDAGIVTIVACSANEVVAGQCSFVPSYTDCNDCLWGANNTYACWCNDQSDNIYGSGGCQPDTDCYWTLVSDIWNGVTGDGGYYGCMTAVPSIGLDAAVPNYETDCSLSVERITVRGSGENGTLNWGGDSPPASCAALTTTTTTTTTTAAAAAAATT